MKFDTSKLVVATLLVNGTSAATWQWGRCKDLPESDLKDFSMVEYAGQWYEIQRDNNLRNWQCVTQDAQYIQNNDKWPL